MRAETGNGYDLSDSARFEAGLPLEPQIASPAPQAHMQALVHDFRRRQRQASMIVAGCVATLRAGRGRHCGIGKLGQAHPGRRRAGDQDFEHRRLPARCRAREAHLAKAAPFTDRLPVEEETASLAPDLGAPPSSSVNAARS